MVFQLIFLALTAAIAYWHYLQGLLSSAISAILTTIAVLMALSYYENLAGYFVGMKYPEIADALALGVIFAVVYIVLRLPFDMLVPGNVRFPAAMEKAGAAILGLYAGLLTIGLLAIAAQTLPFSGTIGGYGRYAVSDDHKVTVSIYHKRAQDMVTYEEMPSDHFNPDDAQHLWLYQDDLVLGLLKRVSDHGSMQGNQPFSSIHPDYLQELFGERLGIQLGAHHTIVNKPDDQVVKVTGVYTQPELVQVDGELPGLRVFSYDTSLDQPLKPKSDQAILIVRVHFTHAASITDVDSLLRISCGAIHLVAGHDTDAGVNYHDYYPVGTLDPTGVAVRNHLDDFLFVDMKSVDHTVDFIFLVDKDAALTGNAAKKNSWKLNDGTFLSVKRYAVIDLGGDEVSYGPPASPAGAANASVLRKPDVKRLIDIKATGLTGSLHRAAIQVQRLKIAGFWTARLGPPNDLSRMTRTFELRPDGTAISTVIRPTPGSPDKKSILKAAGNWDYDGQETVTVTLDRNDDGTPVRESDQTVTFTYSGNPPQEQLAFNSNTGRQVYERSSGPPTGTIAPPPSPAGPVAPVTPVAPETPAVTPTGQPTVVEVKEGGFRFRIGPEWKSDPSTDTAKFYRLTSHAKALFSVQCFRPASPQASLNDAAESSRSDLKSNLPDVRYSQDQATKLGGRPAWLLAFSGSAGNTQARGQMIIAPCSDKAFWVRVTFMTDPDSYDKEGPEVQRVIDSFEWTSNP